MHRKVFLAAALAAVFALPFAAHRAIADSAGGTSATDTQVSIDNYAFKAPKVTITAGTAVVWKNADDDPHTVTADDGSFDSKGLGQGDTYRHVFTKSGTFPYHCSAHPYMKGVVVVAESR
jgi:plastocyanin